MAGFCILSGMQPSEYKALTVRERAAFITALKRKYGQDDDEVEVDWNE